MASGRWVLRVLMSALSTLCTDVFAARPQMLEDKCFLRKCLTNLKQQKQRQIPKREAELQLELLKRGMEYRIPCKYDIKYISLSFSLFGSPSLYHLHHLSLPFFVSFSALFSLFFHNIFRSLFSLSLLRSYLLSLSFSLSLSLFLFITLSHRHSLSSSPSPSCHTRLSYAQLQANYRVFTLRS